jgi:hypothetical protein
MGKGEGSSAETQAHNISGRQKEDRGGCTCTLGEGESAAEVRMLRVNICGLNSAAREEIAEGASDSSDESSPLLVATRGLSALQCQDKEVSGGLTYG